MLHLNVHTPADTPRLRYVLDWLLREQLDVSYRIVTGTPEPAGNRLSYGNETPGAVSIPADGLLFETGVRSYQPDVADWQGTGPFRFDLFSALFFLLTRYEEYNSTKHDQHGRYPHTESILFREGLLEQPVADLWVQRFRTLLNAQFGWSLSTPLARFQPSYDIDIAWSYLHKGRLRSLGGSLRDLSRGKLGERLKVWNGQHKDPYDSFDWLQHLHRQHKLRPLYFILAAQQASAFDKNISPAHPAMQALIARLAAEGNIGLHPSYFSQDRIGVFEGEKEILERITRRAIAQSRQHYIRLWVPATCRYLLGRGIHDDYSMGYASHIGFRAGSSQSFYWYDVETEEKTSLRMHPFCFMDTTAHYDMQLSAEEAFARLRQLQTHVHHTGGVLSTVFHNFSLGNDKEWKGWQEAYASFCATAAE